MEIFNKSVDLHARFAVYSCLLHQLLHLPNRTVHPDTIPLYYKFGFPASGCKISFLRVLHCIFQLKIKAIPLLFKFSRVNILNVLIHNGTGNSSTWQPSYHFACLFFFYISFLKPCCMYIFTPKSEGGGKQDNTKRG